MPCRSSPTQVRPRTPRRLPRPRAHNPASPALAAPSLLLRRERRHAPRCDRALRPSATPGPFRATEARPRRVPEVALIKHSRPGRSPITAYPFPAGGLWRRIGIGNCLCLTNRKRLITFGVESTAPPRLTPLNGAQEATIRTPPITIGCRDGASEGVPLRRRARGV